MKEFSCGDVVPGCNAKFRGKDDDDLLRQVAAHARDGHGIAQVSADLVAAVKSHIRTSSND